MQRKILGLLGAFLAAWLALRFVLPLALPFLLGAAVALAAEPLVRFGQKRLKMPRHLASFAGVTATLALLLTLFTLLGALAVRELGVLMSLLPDVEQTVRTGLGQLREWMLALAERSPEGLRPLAVRSVDGVFQSGSRFLDDLGGRLPGMMTWALGWVSNGTLGLWTGVLAGFLISARLPKLRTALLERLPPVWREQYLPALGRMRRALGGWLRAELTLAAVTYAIVTAGFLLLRVPYAPGWALAVALVDAVPLLGTGTVLLPWALVCAVQGQSLRAVGLTALYAVTFCTRSALEPRLIGRQMGLDPLLSLIVMYVGYRFWGLLGMLAAPVLATAVKSLEGSGVTKRR